MAGTTLDNNGSQDADSQAPQSPAAVAVPGSETSTSKSVPSRFRDAPQGPQILPAGARAPLPFPIQKLKSNKTRLPLSPGRPPRRPSVDEAQKSSFFPSGWPPLSAANAPYQIHEARHMEPLQLPYSYRDAAEKCPPSPHTPQRLRFGSAEDIGCRRSMEDRIICEMDIMDSLLAAQCAAGQEPSQTVPQHRAFFGVLDGHDGDNAAAFAQRTLLANIVATHDFTSSIPAALRTGFLATDRQYGAAVSAGTYEDAGTTALTALVWGHMLYVANLGDCRAVLSHKGKALQLSLDQNPENRIEKKRVLKAGGYFCSDGRLCGQLTVTRCIGDWTLEWFAESGALEQLKSQDGTGPLTAEPEVTEHTLSEEDEFLLMACDGLWGVFSNDRAIEWARLRLQVHNDPQACASELVEEALKRNSTDNISVVVICFNGLRPSKRYGTESSMRNCMSSGAISRLGEFLGQ